MNQINTKLNQQHIKVERVAELIPKVFTASTLLQIYEQVIKEKQKHSSAPPVGSKTNDTTSSFFVTHPGQGP